MAERELSVQAQKEILNSLRGATNNGPAAVETMAQFARVAETRVVKPSAPKQKAGK
jgi:hypothetical protein